MLKIVRKKILIYYEYFYLAILCALTLFVKFYLITLNVIWIFVQVFRCLLRRNLILLLLLLIYYGSFTKCHLLYCPLSFLYFLYWGREKKRNDNSLVVKKVTICNSSFSQYYLQNYGIYHNKFLTLFLVYVISINQRNPVVSKYLSYNNTIFNDALKTLLLFLINLLTGLSVL